MRQTTKFYAVLLCAALGFSTSIQSCKDYDDDIDSLNERIDAVNKSLEDLKKDFGALAYVKDVKWDESTRTLTITPATGNPVTYTIADANTQDGNTKYTLTSNQAGNKITITLKGDDSSEQKVEFELPSAETITKDDITVNDEGYICVKGDATSVKMPQDFDFTKMEVVKEEGKLYLKYGDSKKELTAIKEFDPTALTLASVDGKIVLTYLGEKVGEPIELPAATAIIEKEDGSGFIIKVGDKQVDIVNLNILRGELKSLVFIPEVYKEGIESILVQTIKYKAWNLQTLDVNLDDAVDKDNAEFDKQSTGNTTLTPMFAASYHLNPSNVSADSLSPEKMSFLAKDVNILTKAPGLMPTITGRTVENGILTVSANLSGDIKDFTEQVSVLALQVKNGGVTVTSDYAALAEKAQEDLVLSLINKTTPGECTAANHLPTSIKDAIDLTSPHFKIEYDAKGFDIAKEIQTHIGKEADHAVLDKGEKTVGNYGFKYVYELVGWNDGNNETSQSAHAILNGSVIRPQLTLNGKQNTNADAPQGRASIGRMPIVRVTLIDTVTNKEKFAENKIIAAAVGYIKFEIVGKEDLPENVIIPSFKDNKPFTVSCDNKYNKALKWYEVEEQIYTALKMSKAEFEAKYELDMNVDNSAAKQFTSTGTDAQETSSYLGKVEITTADVNGNMTEVLQWSIEDNDVYEYFITADPKNTSAKAIVRFKLKDESKTKAYVYVTFEWTPSELNINPSVTIDNKSKIAEYWYSLNSKGAGFEEIHAHVAVPVNVPSDATECKYEKDLHDYFAGGKVGVTVDNETTYQEFFDGEEKYTFKFTELRKENNTIKVGSTTYNLGYTTEDEKQYLTATEDGTTIYRIVELGADGKLTYQDNTVAKAILNAYGRGQYEDRQTLAARIAISAINGCDHSFKVNDNAFEVRFLRPINVTVNPNKGLIDALDKGDNLKLSEVLKFVDWRGEGVGTFTEANKLFTYYGVSAVNVNKDNITTNLNNGTLGETLITAVNSNIQINYTSATALGLNDLGTLNYKNNSGELRAEFQIRVPVTITYKWGDLIVDVDITIHPTIGGK